MSPSVSLPFLHRVLRHFMTTPPDDFDVSTAVGEIEALFMTHPIMSRSGEWSSPMGALLADAIADNEDVRAHPSSLAALRMCAIIEGVALSVLGRVRHEFSAHPWDEDRAYDILCDHQGFSYWSDDA